MIERGTKIYRDATRALGLGSLLVLANLYMFQPLLPELAVEFDVVPTQVNWVHAASTLGLAIGLLPWAIYSERLGRRQVLLTGLLLVPVVGVFQPFTESLVSLTILRFLLGLAISGFLAVAVTYIAEEFSITACAVAVGGFVSANTVGGLMGRLYGGIVGEAIGWQAAAGSLALITALGSWGVVRLLPKAQRFEATSLPTRYRVAEAVALPLEPRFLLAMFIGGLNFALFINQYSVMGFRMVGQPFNLSVSIVSLIFICYLGGTFSSRLSGMWSLKFGPLSGMVLGTTVALAGVLIARVEWIGALVLGLLLISGGAFFVHALAYAWVNQKAKRAKASATALYLVHYYIGGSLGGFWLLYCWEKLGWDGVILGSSLIYLVIYLLIALLRWIAISSSPKIDFGATKQ